MRLKYLASAAALALLAVTSPAFADVEAAKKWIDSEFQPSTLSKETAHHPRHRHSIFLAEFRCGRTLG